MKKIVLFYKKLIEPGGAERLLVNEYVEFSALGYDVDIVSLKISNDALFGEEINTNNKIELGDWNWFLSIIKLILYIKKNKQAIYLCASGHIEMYVASLFTNIKYSLHIHHPSFMSFNETDKYSLFQKKHFAKMLESNFGADRFRQIYLNMSFSKKLYINLKAFISIKAIKRSKINFVLSKYAQYEKKTLFGIDAYVLCGAIKESIFEYQVTKNFSQYNKFRHKILTIARLDENKRIDKLLHAFKEYLLIEPKSIFLIGGRGPETNKLKNLVNILNISENVEFLGFISENELLDWYAMADIFVSIDWADYRITMYESLAMNTKVLLSNETDVDRFFLDAKYLYITQPDIKNTSKTLALSLNEQPNVTYKSLKCYLYEFTWHQYSVNIASILDK